MIRRWWFALFPPEKRILALRDLVREPDDDAMAQYRPVMRARIRYQEPDEAERRPR